MVIVIVVIVRTVDSDTESESDDSQRGVEDTIRRVPHEEDARGRAAPHGCWTRPHAQARRVHHHPASWRTSRVAAGLCGLDAFRIPPSLLARFHPSCVPP